jgi:hypothetical protein
LKPITTLFRKQGLNTPKHLNAEVELMLNILLDYIKFLKINTENNANPYVENEKLVYPFQNFIKIICIETQYEKELKNSNVDCIKHFDPLIFQSLSTDNVENAKIIGNAYDWLQTKENPVRNNIILLSIRCKDIAMKHWNIY